MNKSFTLKGCAYVSARRAVFFLACLTLFIPRFAGAKALDTQNVGVVISSDIRPYNETAAGLSQELAGMSGITATVYYLDKYNQQSRIALIKRVIQEGCSLLVAVGPEAANLVWEINSSEHVRSIYSIVLNPGNISAIDEASCGIPLNIPIGRQIHMIRSGLPEIKKIGLLVDPRYNSDFVGRAKEEARLFDLSIIPLYVSSKNDIPDVLKRGFKQIDALWLVPDRTVISESIVQYIIKEGLLKNIPVVGYNKFFYDRGAALSFIFDYEQLGRQTGRMVIDSLAGRPCGKQSPMFQVWLNTRIFNMIGLGVPVIKSDLIQVKP